MADGTHIEWTDATWNPVTGCSVVSPGCTNCYAMKLAGGRLRHHPSRKGLTRNSKAGPVWTGEVRFNEAELLKPLSWKRPRKIFACAHGDLFHPDVPDAWIDQVFAVAALCPHHVVQVLTKRSARMREYMSKAAGRIADAIIALRRQRGDDGVVVPLPHVAPGAPWWPLPNVWLGVSAEDQERADERLPDLLATPAAVRFLSAEPLLGPIDLTAAWHTENALSSECWGQCGWCPAGHPPLHNCQNGRPSLYEGRFQSGLDWVIVGGESGPGARPMHPDWARLIRDACADAGVAFHFKQHGAWKGLEAGDGEWPTDSGSFIRLTFEGERAADGWPMQRVGKKFAGRVLDGVTHDAFPLPLVEEPEACECGEAFKEGDLVIHSVDGGYLHADCCGPERESYVNLETGEPIGPDDPIPTPFPWTANG